MDPIDNMRAIAQEILAVARQQGINLEPFCTDGHFQKARRWIYVWRKDERPGSGPTNVKEGTLLYNMQGSISVLPNKMKESASAFRGMWVERGSFENIEQAVEFLKAWLLDGKEVDDLPDRSVRAYGI